MFLYLFKWPKSTDAPTLFLTLFLFPHVAAKEPHCRLCLTFFPPLVSLHTRDTNVSVCLCWVIVQPLHLYFVSLIERKRDSPQGEPRLAQPVLWRATQGLKRATQTLLVAVEMMGRLECVSVCEKHSKKTEFLNNNSWLFWYSKMCLKFWLKCWSLRSECWFTLDPLAFLYSLVRSTTVYCGKVVTLLFYTVSLLLRTRLCLCVIQYLLFPYDKQLNWNILNTLCAKKSHEVQFDTRHQRDEERQTDFEGVQWFSSSPCFVPGAHHTHRFLLLQQLLPEKREAVQIR